MTKVPPSLHSSSHSLPPTRSLLSFTTSPRQPPPRGQGRAPGPRSGGPPPPLEVAAVTETPSLDGCSSSPDCVEDPARGRGARAPPLHPRWIRGRRPRRRDAARRTAALRGTAGQACEEDGSGARDDAATCTVHKAFPVRLWLPTSPSPGALSLSLWRATRSGGGWGVGDDGRRCVVA
jgi:hypothetical protein